MKAGDLIYLDDGLISLRAEKIEADGIQCVVVNSERNQTGGEQLLDSDGGF